MKNAKIQEETAAIDRKQKKRYNTILEKHRIIILWCSVKRKYSKDKRGSL